MSFWEEALSADPYHWQCEQRNAIQQSKGLSQNCSIWGASLVYDLSKICLKSPSNTYAAEYRKKIHSLK